MQIVENSEVEQIANDGRHAKYNFPFPKRAVGKISFVSVEMFTGSWLCNSISTSWGGNYKSAIIIAGS